MNKRVYCNKMQCNIITFESNESKFKWINQNFNQLTIESNVTRMNQSTQNVIKSNLMMNTNPISFVVSSFGQWETFINTKIPLETWTHNFVHLKNKL